MKIFSIDNVIFKGISRVGDMFILSLLWLLTSLPVVTIGASTTALLDVCIKILRSRDTGIFKNYFVSFKNNFMQSTVIWLIFLPLVSGVYCLSYLAATQIADKTLSLVLTGLGVGALIPLAFTLVFVFAVQAVFENPVKATIRTAFNMSMKHWVTALLIVVSSVGLFYVCYMFPIVAYFFFFFGIGLFAMIFSVRYLTVFRLYNDALKPDEIEGGKELPSFPENKNHKKTSPPSAKISSGKIIR